MPKRLKGVPNLPFPPIVAGVYGLVAGGLLYATPQWLFEHMVDLSGIAQLVPAAQPPLGENARLIAAVASVVAVFAILWPLFAIVQTIIRKSRKQPVVHQRARGIVIAGSMADAAPAPLELEARMPTSDVIDRAPLFAENELGAPLMSEAALEAADELMLDQPLDGGLLAQPGMAEAMADEIEQAAQVGEAEHGFQLSSFAPVLPETAPQWTARAVQDYPTPPIYAPIDHGSQFRIPEPVAAPVAAEAPAPVAEPGNLGFSALTAAAAPAASFDPFADGQSWNIAGMDTAASASTSDDVTPQPSFSAGFNPLAVDLGGPQDAQQGVPAPADVHSAPDCIDPFNISFAVPDVAEAAVEAQAAAVQSPVPCEPASALPEAMDNSVGGLMSRLNMAMGGKVRPAAQHSPAEPMRVSMGLDNLRAV